MKQNDSCAPIKNEKDPAPCLSPGTQAKKPYHTPELKCFGRVADLTQFGGSVVLDTGGGLGPEA